MACFEIRHEAKQQPDERAPQATIDAAPQPQAWQARLKRLCRHERFSTRIKHDANPVPRSACREKLDFIAIGRCQLYAMQGRLANAATNLREIDLRCFARETSFSSIVATATPATSTIRAAPYGRKPETAIPSAHTPTMPATSKAAHSSTGRSVLNASL